MVGIYKITNKVNGNLHIGKSKDIFEVFRKYRDTDNEVFNELPLANEVIEFGLDKFDFDILEECPEDQLDIKEFYYMNLYGIPTENSEQMLDKAKFIGGSLLFGNKKPGGRKNNPNVGIGLKRHVQRMRTDPEYRELMVAKYKNNRPNSIPIDMIDIATGEVIMSFPKIMDGAKWIRENTSYKKADYSTINKICKGNGKTAYGYKWQYTRNRQVD